RALRVPRPLPPCGRWRSVCCHHASLYPRPMDLWEGVWQPAVLLLFVMDPFGNVPLALALLKDVPEERRRRVVLRELVIALLVLLVFLVFGRAVLALLGLEGESGAMAGGIGLGVIGLRMVCPRAEGVIGYQVGGGPLFVPVA